MLHTLMAGRDSLLLVGPARLFYYDGSGTAVFGPFALSMGGLAWARAFRVSERPSAVYSFHGDVSCTIVLVLRGLLVLL